MDDNIQFEETDVAVVGMAARLPGANDVQKFWENLRDGVETYQEFSDEELLESGVPYDLINNPNYVKVGRPLDNMEMFDAPLFGFTPKDASIMDPQHRHFLEVAWEALEHAGYDPEQYDGAIGVFGGSGHNVYMPYNLFSNPDLMNSVGLFLVRHTSNDKDFLTTRVSYCMNLKGPSINVQTACSTSLVATHLGVQSLISGECDMALAGGVTIELPHRVGYLYKDGEILSPDGHCRAFDEKSKGTVFGSGAGIIVLKRMEDAVKDGDTIHAVIKASAINNDGSNKVGYLAPSVEGQSEAITEALSLSGVDADSISYIETHGTGTPVGDPIEITALTDAFRTQTDNSGFCAIGSVKTNIGHLDTAAGVAGLIKIIQSLKHKELPPSLNYTAPNPRIDFEHSPFYVNAKLKPWDTNGKPRRAAINSLGVGGTNAHIILEEAPERKSSNASRKNQIICLSARTRQALDALSDKLGNCLQERPDLSLADIAHTLRVGRKTQAFRRVLVGETTDDVATTLVERPHNRVSNLQYAGSTPSVVFMFTGQGSQYINMGKGLYESEAVFKQALDECINGLEAHLDTNLLELMFPHKDSEPEAKEKLQQTKYTQPALFALEYALAKQLMHWGITPDAMIGHSIGEYVAACISGVFELSDALKLVANRGRLMQSLPGGSMLAIPLNQAEVQKYLNEKLSLAAVNSPGLCVLSGDHESIDELQKQLENEEVNCKRLLTSHAFHSIMMEPILDEFRSLVSNTTISAPQIPFISNHTADWITDEQVQDPGYWANHLRHAVRFADGIGELLKEPNRVFLELGPGNTLSSLAGQHADKTELAHLYNSVRHPKEESDDVQYLLKTLGNLWMSGVAVDWQAVENNESRRRIPLPTYPFEHQRHWIEAGAGAIDAYEPTSMMHKEEPAKWFYHPTWESSVLPDTALNVGDIKNILFFVNENDFIKSLVDEYRQFGCNVIEVRNSGEFKKNSATSYEIKAGSEPDINNLFSSIGHDGLVLSHVVHGWLLDGYDKATLDDCKTEQDLGFYTMLGVSKALANMEAEENILVSVLADNMQKVANERIARPTKATVLGPVKVMSQEIENVLAKSFDIGLHNLKAWEEKELLNAVFHETLNNNNDDEEIVYRGGARFVKDFKPIKSDFTFEESTAPLQFKPDATYLITGGIGGLGSVLATHIAETCKANIVLASRTAIPDKSEWGDWLENNDSSDKISERIRAVQEIEALGSRVLTVTADVANPDQMKFLVKQCRNEFGGINGVFHTAGVVKDNLIALKSFDDAKSVLSPKLDGTIVLDKVLEKESLDFIVLFSSVSSFLGLGGQIDYTAANVFLDSYAQYKKDLDGTRVLAVNWGVWSDVGMAASLASDLGVGSRNILGNKIEHYFFERHLKVGTGVDEYTAVLSTRTHWLLDGHRNKKGVSLVPGTAYLEMARAAFNGAEEDKAIELADVFFLSPFAVEGDEKKEIKVSLTQTAHNTGFVIQSEHGEENVRGVIKYSDEKPLPNLNIEAIRERCNSHEEVLKGTAEHNHLDFGSQWKCVDKIFFGKKEALVEIGVPDEFVNELDNYVLHPAVMDMATGTAQSLNPDYDAEKDLYIPISYTKIKVYKPLKQKMYSHVIYGAGEGEGSQTSIFDVVICDENGEALVVIDNFVMKRIDPAVLLTLKSNIPLEVISGENKTASERFFESGLLAGMTSGEGVKVIDYLLSSLTSAPQVIVSTINLHEYINEARKLRTVGDLDDDLLEEELLVAQERPNISVEYVAPETKMEKDIASVWKATLGLGEIGVNDDFFELGGHSLLLTQTVSRLRKKLNIELPISSLFETPTIAEWADVLSDESVISGEVIPPVIPLPRQKYISIRSEVTSAA